MFIDLNMSNLSNSPSFSSFDECPVCFEEKYAKYASRLKCGHKLCSECLANHSISSLQKNNKVVDCPLCRSTIIDITPIQYNRNLNIELIPTINENEQQIENPNYKSLYCCMAIILLFIVPYLLMKLLEDLADIQPSFDMSTNNSIHP